MFGFVYLKNNKFEANHLFVKTHLTWHYLLFDDESNNILNVFYLDLIWTCFNINMKMFDWKYLNMFELKSFYEKNYTLYLLVAIIIKNIWSITYWVLSLFSFINNFLNTLSLGKEWRLGWDFAIIRTFGLNFIF